MSAEEVVAVLEDLEGALEVWSHRWGLRGEPRTTISNLDISQNGAVDFHFHLTRFLVNTFATRFVLEKTRYALVEDDLSQPGLTHLAQESVLKSVRSAHSLSRYLADTPPLRRENICYMAEFGFSSIAFSCVYIVQAYELFGTALPILQKFLPSVQEVATFMSEMAVAGNTAPHTYGLTVLRHLKKISRWNGATYGNLQTSKARLEESVGGEQPAAPSWGSTDTIQEDTLATPFEDAFPIDGRQIHSLPTPNDATSPLLFSMFDIRWGPPL